MNKKISESRINYTGASQDVIQNMIYIIRGQKVMLDSDLAILYGVTTGRLNEQVKRNIKRFPEDFMFQLNSEELKSLMSQFAISSWGGRRKLPLVFTEQGVSMLSGVLSSDRAIQVNITIMRTFAKLREMISTHKELAAKLEKMEQKLGQHDEDIQSIIRLIRKLHSEPEKPKTRIGFHKNL
ncbi:MAG: ORF6N domain-containing protein [Candidatus Omnitrophica bacterium]|nr:ORF6N domain-containing protein [Candidatus Omnitrophota bacterium]